GFMTPKVSLQNTHYELTDQTAGKPNSITRTLPIVSLDNGLFLDREFDLGSSSLKQTLEPRLFYLYIPRDDQKDIPVFDTSLYDFWFTNLFRENRFSGSDRVQDANQITAGLTTRLLDSATGRDKLKFSLGEIIYFQNREVTLPVRLRYLPSAVVTPPQGLESPIETETLSPLIAELSGALSDYWTGETGIQWSPDSNDIVGGKAVLHFIKEDDKILNLGFRYRQSDLPERILRSTRCPPNTTGTPVDCWYPTNSYNPLNDKKVLQSSDLIQSDLSFRWPLAESWYGVGRWVYSWLYNSTQESFIGVEKENCCWRFRVIGRRWTNNINTVNSVNSQLTEGTSQTGVFFQVELKGLTGIGEKLDEFFEQSIYGYRKPVK
ncbi:MAG: LPS-assembly protein LptD, partial [Gammaproteobacteria bacterium]